jgi:hypothetical protein
MRAAAASRSGVEGLVRKDIFGGRVVIGDCFEGDDMGRGGGFFGCMVVTTE